MSDYANKRYCPTCKRYISDGTTTHTCQKPMTEPKVVRYRMLSPADIRKDGTGSWVRYSNYEALAARVQELEEAQEIGGLARFELDKAIEPQKADNKRLREALLILATVGEHELLDSDADRMAEFAAEALKEKP